MKKNTYLIILTIVTIVCIIAGTGMHLLNWKADSPIYFSLFSGSSHAKEDNTAGNVTDSQAITEEFNQIHTNLNTMDLTIVKGDETKLSFRGKNNLKPNVEVKDGSLNITEPEHHGIIEINRDYSATLTLPDDKELKNVTLDTSDSDLVLNGLKIKELQLKSLDGDFNQTDCTIEHSKLNFSDGDINLTRSDITTLNIESYDGDICLTQCKTGTTSGKTYDGDISLISTAFNTLSISAYDGDISVSNSTNDLSEYTMQLTSEDGDITVNNKTCSGNYNQTGTGQNSINVDTSSGDIIIR